MLPLIPAYPGPPYRYRRVVGSNLLCRADPSSLERLIPAPLHLHPEHHVWMYGFELSGDEPVAIDYHEIGVFVTVLWGDQPGLYPLVLFLDQTLPILIGREIWGFPKRYAAPIVVERDSELARASVSPEIHSSLRWSMRVAADHAEQFPTRRQRIFTHRYLPAPDLTSAPAVDELVELHWQTAEERRYRGSHMQWVSNWSAFPQLKALEKLEIIAGWYSEIEGLVLEAGRRIHRFE
jgi:acetoacetate decarboxylase